jgi:hypothetical protein
MVKGNGRSIAYWSFLGMLLGLGAWTATSQSAAEDKRITDADLAAWVTKQAQDWQPQAAERRFDDIGWVKDIRTAERLAQEHQRPVFLFTHDGRMAVGRC